MLSIKQIAETSIERVKRDKDLSVAVTGFEGDGKSALASDLGIALDPFFQFDRNMLFYPTSKEINDKIYNLPRFTPIIADEAIKILYKLNWASKVNKYLNVVYAVCRNQNKISIFNMPRFTDFTEYFRNHRIKLWIHIIDPLSNQKENGLAVVMSRSWNPVTGDPWGLKDFEKQMMFKRRRKKDAEYSLDDKISLFSRMPTYVDTLKFGWIDNARWKEYLRLKAQSAAEMEDLAEPEAKAIVELEGWKVRTITCIKAFLAAGFEQKAIAKLLKVPPRSVTAWLKQEKVAKEIDKFNNPAGPTD
jgi:hypothetical protein